MQKVRVLVLAALCACFLSCPNPAALKTGTLTVVNGTNRNVVDVDWAGIKLGRQNFYEILDGKAVYSSGISFGQEYVGLVYAGTGFVTYRFQNFPNVLRSAAVTVPENGTATITLR